MAISQTDHSSGLIGRLPRWSAAVLGLGAVTIWVALGGVTAEAATTVNLATAAPFAVLAGTTVTNTGTSVITGDLGLSPGSSVTGSPTVIGTSFVDDPVAVQAKSDLTKAYVVAAGDTRTATVSTDLGGQTLTAGVYFESTGLGLTGTLTLNGQDNPNSVFIFQTGSSSLTTASASSVVLENMASACNVFWQVGSEATLGSTTAFVGTILAADSVSLNTGATVVGRVLAQTAEVSLEGNTISVPTTCNTTPTPTPTPTTTSTPSPTTTTTSTPSPTTTPGTRVPVPATGAGGTSGFGGGSVLLLGGLVLLGAGVAMGTIRRRRLSSTR